MNKDFTRLLLIVLGVLVLFYIVNRLGLQTPVQNKGDLSMDYGPQMSVIPTVPESAQPSYDPGVTVDDPYDEPIPGSPEGAMGGAIDKLNWDGLGERQISGVLSKQYQDLVAEDLLPHNDMAHWADIYPNGTGQTQNKNFLHSGHHVGINTVGQHLKNPNLQLRSEPINPQVLVSP